MVNSTTSNATIKELHSILSTHSLPDIIALDNGTVFYTACQVEWNLSQRHFTTQYLMAKLKDL